MSTSSFWEKHPNKTKCKTHLDKTKFTHIWVREKWTVDALRRTDQCERAPAAPAGPRGPRQPAAPPPRPRAPPLRSAPPPVLTAVALRAQRRPRAWRGARATPGAAVPAFRCRGSVGNEGGRWGTPTMALQRKPKVRCRKPPRGARVRWREMAPLPGRTSRPFDAGGFACGAPSLGNTPGRVSPCTAS